MYEVYYAYGMNKGTTITYTSILEEATSFVKAMSPTNIRMTLTESRRFVFSHPRI